MSGFVQEPRVLSFAHPEPFSVSLVQFLFWFALSFVIELSRMVLHGIVAVRRQHACY